MKQLFETVKSLCAAVVTLTNNMKNMMETVGQSNANPVNPSAWEALRLTIREEVMEMEEREKGKSLIVLKDLEVPSGREFVEVFEDDKKYILGFAIFPQLIPHRIPQTRQTTPPKSQGAPRATAFGSACASTAPPPPPTPPPPSPGPSMAERCVRGFFAVGEFAVRKMVSFT